MASEIEDDASDEASSVYKVVELSTVTDESIERALNEWAQKGFVLDGMQFAMRESSRRPSMAFLVFTQVDAEPGDPRPRFSQKK